MATVNFAAIEQLLPDIYGAALQPELWPVVLGGLCRAVGAAGGELVNAGILLNQGWVVHDFPETIIETYLEKYAATDTVLPAIMAKAAKGPIIMDFAADNLIRNTPYFNDVVRPSGIRSFCLAGLGQAAAAGFEFVAFARSPRQRPFGPEAVRVLDRVAPHLRSAGIVQMRLEASTDHYRGALDALAAPLILLDGRGCIVYMNRAADALLRMNDGLTILKGALRAANPQADALLAGALAGARGVLTEGALAHGGEIALQRPSGKAPLLVQIAPLGRGNPQCPPGVRAALAVFIQDPESHPRTTPARLRAAYGLTAAEARVALALAEGLSPAEIAEQQGCQPKTVRTQLESLFAKLGVRRQTQAVKRVLATAASFEVPPDPGRDR